MTQPDAARELRACFRGPVHEPGGEHYDDQRAALHPAVDSRPDVVAEALTPADVQNAVLIARRHGLRLAVQGTGHGTRVACDGGLLLRTPRMREVLVDPDRRVARVGAGVRWSQVIEAAAPFGLAPITGTHATVGAAGYTLGGGVGWLSRRYGFAADSLLRAEVVTADGRLLHVSADRHPDLFWALRGAGANFGVVTSMEIRLHPVARVYAGTALFPLARAEHALARFRDLAPAMPRELSASLTVMRESGDPRVSGPVLAVRGCYAGDADDAVRALLPLWRAAGTPLVDDFRSMATAQTESIGATRPLHFELFADLPDALIGSAVDALSRPVGADAIEVRHWGGAMADAGTAAGPVGHRDVPFSMTVDGSADSMAALRPYATGGSFLNFLGDQSRTADAYTPANYARLRELKRVFDPDNVLGLTHNITPADTGAGAAAEAG